MIDKTQLISSIQAGEDTKLELKEVVFRGERIALAREEGRAAARLAEVFVSMANTEGGTVVLGVRDSDRVPVGIPPDKRDLLEQFVVNVASNNCNPAIIPALDWEYLPGENETRNLCLIVEIPASKFDVHQTSDGRFLQRVSSHRQLIPAERLARMLTERRLASPLEERPLVGTSLDDLDKTRLELYFKRRFPDWSAPEDWASTLAAHKLAVISEMGSTPTHLGILLFAEQPEQYISGSYIDLAVYHHDIPDGNTVDSRQFTGPLPEQIAKVVSYFQASPLTPIISRKSGDGRRDYPSYEYTALQEAVVNAVIHRDYEVAGSQIIIRMFPDRIEFQNPGALYNTLTIENLYAGCQPARRNQFITGFMRYYKSPVTGSTFLEGRGEGFLNLVRDSLRLSGQRPELEQIGAATKLTIYAAQYPELV